MFIFYHYPSYDKLGSAKIHKSKIFARHFVPQAPQSVIIAERKQIAMIADEKSPARISHRIFATRSLRNVGNGMNEKSLEVLKQYDFEVNRVLRGRGGMILNTDRGVKLFLECV